MPDYWGASADPNYGYSPYSGQLHYGQHQYSQEPFTPPPGEGNSLTIELVEMRINNAHPEQIAALADQWQNVATMLSNVRTYVLAQSNVLHNEHWNSPKARDAFLKMGPGQALAYLDVWIEAVQKNVTALRHLVNITRDARTEMAELMRQYREALEGAKNGVDFGDQVGEWVQGFTVTWDEAEDREIKENVDRVTQEYQQKAQSLAHRVGDQYFDYTGTLASAVGPPFRPMDAVLNNPGAPPAPPPPANLPSTAPAPPPAVAPAPPPPPPANGLPNPTDLKPPGQHEGPIAPPDPTPAPPGNPVPTPTPPPGVLPPGILPPGLRPGPPPLPPGVLPPPPQQFANRPGVRPPVLNQDLNRTGGAPPPATNKPPNPGQLTKNAFGNPGTSQPPGPGGQPPGRTLRRPNNPGNTPAQPGPKDLRRPGATQPNGPGTGQPNRPGERRRGERSDGTNRVPGTPIDGEEAFGRPPGSTAPPVLKNPTGDRSRRRPGSAEELRPAAHAGDDPTIRKDGTAPPVLNRPTRPGDATPPPGRGRTRSNTDRRTPAGADWIGADEARADAGSSVLDAPTPPTGDRVSRLEEIPKELRSRAATRDTSNSPARPGTVSPELSKRHTGDERVVQPADDEARGVVTDEQAFEVQTPGGAVVTSQRDEPVYEPETPRAIRGR